MARDCPDCLVAAAILRRIAGGLAEGAGMELGFLLGGPAGARIGGDVMPLAVSAGADIFTERVMAPRRKKRQASAYQKELGRQMKAWKKAHPRSGPGSILSHAHKKTRAIIRKKQKKGTLPRGSL